MKFPVLLLVATLGPSVLADAAAPGAPPLAILLEQALRASPRIAALRSEQEAARQGETVAGALPDPMLRGMTMPELPETRLELEQTFPLAGKRRLGNAAARQATRAVSARVRAEELAVAFEVTSAYVHYWLLGRSLAITRESRGLVAAWEDVARVRFAGGRGNQQVVLKVDVEAGILDNRIRTLEALQPTWIERLNALLDRPPGSPLGWPAPDSILPRQLARELPELRELLRKRSPELAATASELERARVEEVAARRAKVPDLTLGVRYTRERMPADPTTGLTEDRDSFMTSVGVNLPFGRSKYRAIEGAAAAQRRAAEQRMESTTNSLEARLEQVHYEYRDALRKLDLYRDRLIPRARQTLAAASYDFQAGSGGFLDLVDVQRELLEFQLEEADAVAGRARSLAELEMIVGEPVSKAASPETTASGH